MSIPASNLLQVLATWPVLRDTRFDPNIPSPWRGIAVPATDDPFHPTIAIIFNHSIDPAIYTSDSALSPYLLLTSITDPSARNIDTFKNVKFDPLSSVLTFQPKDPLSAGCTYGATLRGSTRDAAGRSLDRAYYWEFEVESSLYQGLSIPLLISPPDQTVVINSPFSLQWKISDSAQKIPSGQEMVFVVTAYDTRTKNHVLWEGSVYASDAGSTVP